MGTGLLLDLVEVVDIDEPVPVNVHPGNPDRVARALDLVPDEDLVLAVHHAVTVDVAGQDGEAEVEVVLEADQGAGCMDADWARAVEGRHEAVDADGGGEGPGRVVRRRVVAEAAEAVGREVDARQAQVAAGHGDVVAEDDVDRGDVEERQVPGQARSGTCSSSRNRPGRPSPWGGR